MFFLVYYIMNVLITSQCCKAYEIHKYVQASQGDMKYCSKIGNCEPGTHVACMYPYGQNSMGPKCDTNAKQIKLTKGMQTQILSTINGIRKRLSEGIETGDKHEILPRAYGMVHIQWDQELADLAQLWANQCEDGYDRCRSTEKFPNVAQTDYSFIKRRHDVHNSLENILTANKLEKIIDTSIEYWRRSKEGVTRQMILNSGYFLEYMQMIHGQNTHLGCGMAAYTSDSFYNKTRNPSYLVIKLVCNWSHKLKQSSMVYDIDPPQGRSGGRSKNCGCYSGQIEADGCLCILENTASLDMEMSKVARTDTKCDRSAHANIVILPVFTFEDGHNIPLSKITNATVKYIETLPVKSDARYYDGGPAAPGIPHIEPLRVPPVPITRNHMMYESIQHQEPRIPNLKNLNSRDISRLKELVQDYLVNDKHLIPPPVIPVDALDTRRSSKTPRYAPVKVEQPSYDYPGYFDNSVQPRTRRIPFGLKEPNYHHSPDIRNKNGKDLNHLLIALLENLVYHGNVNNLIEKMHDTEVDEERNYNGLIMPPKPMKRSHLIDDLEHYEEEARDDKINSNYGRLIGDESRERVGRVSPTIRKQNPLTHNAYDNNYDYYTNDVDYENEKIIRNIERDILQSNLDKEKYVIDNR